MKPINLLNLCNYKIENDDDIDFISQYENAYSERNEKKLINRSDIDALNSLVGIIKKQGGDYTVFENFYFSYHIQQISKEFDLLKISNDKKKVINIELKTEKVEQENIKYQLNQNRFYLSIFDEIIQYTYVASINKLFRLVNDDLIEANIKDLIYKLNCFNEAYVGDIDSLFNPNKYLISPINDANAFVENKYFLNDQQSDFKDKILKDLDEYSDKHFIGLTGKPGTGKTLLLYDIMKELSKESNVLMFYCVQEQQIYKDLEHKLKTIGCKVSICPIKMIFSVEFNEYKYIFIDEAQRIWPNQFDFINKVVISNNIKVLLSYDVEQVLSKKEENYDFYNNIKKQLITCEYKLTTKIRTNKKIFQFIKSITDKKHGIIRNNYDCVNILFCNSVDDAIIIIDRMKNQGYKFIPYTKSKCYESRLDFFSSHSDVNAHSVVGQEFEKVLIYIDENFKYDNGRLASMEHPCPDYLYWRMLYQAISRVRSELCIIVINNKDIFNYLIKVKNGILENNNIKIAEEQLDRLLNKKLISKNEYSNLCDKLCQLST